MAKIVILLMQIEIVQIQLYARRDIFVVSCWEALEASDSEPQITSLAGQIFKSQRRWNIKEAKLFFNFQ